MYARVLHVCEKYNARNQFEIHSRYMYKEFDLLSL